MRVGGVDDDDTSRTRTTDPDPFADLYREHFAPLVRVAFLMTGSHEAAEDAVHETFLRCRTRLPTLDHPRSYLRAAVINECRSVHRRAALATRVPAGPTSEMPNELVELQDALARLPWRQRAAIVLRYFVDIPDAEIAIALDCRPATVRSHIRRGLAALKEVLA